MIHMQSDRGGKQMGWRRHNTGKVKEIDGGSVEMQFVSAPQTTVWKMARSWTRGTEIEAQRADNSENLNAMAIHTWMIFISIVLFRLAGDILVYLLHLLLSTQKVLAILPLAQSLCSHSRIGIEYSVWQLYNKINENILCLACDGIFPKDVDQYTQERIPLLQIHFNWDN